MGYETFLIPPEDFSSSLEVASCYCKVKERILLLKRHPMKSQGGTWGVPAGKLEKGEQARAAVIREVWEEVGLRIDDEYLQDVGELYIRLPQMDYVFHLFHYSYTERPSIDLGLEEHEEARWVTIEEARRLPLIAGGKEALHFYETWMLERIHFFGVDREK